ncbi:MAG: tRNA 2-thiouridine(34) synthase MnmA [Desulfobacterales bacterium]|jgi:tRNA-specific 2-thiouridylase|nr:tRNA 2-thiouridine(34) synthase MnmA [Desulfobacterales bacterium]MDH4009299.1 tRNA 2-thiouridine(34) synthase MnmA [Desulfobacterales bacterium]
MKKKKLKVAVGLSGGVDSSVAAALLCQQDYEVYGITMEIYDGSVQLDESAKHACYGPGEKEDVESAAAICEKLKIPFQAIDLRQEYKTHVIDYFRNEYLEGKTPNPCVVCNQKLKFGFLLEKARQAGCDFDYFATGHYARIVKSGNRFLLKRATDRLKDQTYFLYGLMPQQLARSLFPVGDHTKQQVREMARALGLQTADREESQDFIDGGDYSILFSEDEINAGEIVDENGRVLGEHRGIIHYTIGQRRGLGIASHQPLYVSRIDAANNRIVVSPHEHRSKGLVATDLNLIAVDRIERPLDVQVKIRLRHKETAATVYPAVGDQTRILFEKPQMSVTPGQSAVIYAEDTVLGGGIITAAL